MRWIHREGRDALGPTPEQHRSTDAVPTKGVGQAHCKLCQPLPEVAFGIRGCFPEGLQDLVGVERAALVQQPLGFGKTFVRRQDKALGNTLDPGVPTAKGAAKRIAGAGVAGTTDLVPLPVSGHGTVSSRRRIRIHSQSTSTCPSLSPSRRRVDGTDSLTHLGCRSQGA